MKDFSLVGRSESVGLLSKLRQLRLVFACVVLVMCFLIANDVYGARTVAERHKDALNGPRQRTVDYATIMKQRVVDKVYRSESKPRYLIDPKATSQRSMISALAFQADICNQNTSFVTALPFSDTGTTVGATDDYDLGGAHLPGNFDPTGCPSPTCEAFSGAPGQVTPPDRGYTYLGSGTGLDVAYKIAFIQPTTLRITLDPTDVGTMANPIGDDLNIIVYDATCSNSPSNAIVMADNAGSGNPPDLPDNSEEVNFTLMPAGIYNIVVDGYSYAGDPPTAGPYTINISCIPGQACAVPGYRVPPRR